MMLLIDKYEGTKFYDTLLIGISKKEHVGWISSLFPVPIAKGVKALFELAVFSFRTFQANQNATEVPALGPIMKEGNIVFAPGDLKETGQSSGGFREPEPE